MQAEIEFHSVNFLDLTVYKGPKFRTSGHLDSKVYFKPTDSHQLLHTNSFHRKHTFPGIVKSQILRYYRNCSDLTEFNKACTLLEQALAPRGYKKSFFRKIKTKLLKEITYKDPIGISKCLQKRCLLCPQLNIGNQIQIGPHTFKIKEPLDCHTSNLIYVLSCQKCNLHYVGKLQHQYDNAPAHTGILSDIRRRLLRADTSQRTSTSQAMNLTETSKLLHYKPLH